MWRSILVGCAYGLALHTTLQTIYYDLPSKSRIALMASIEHENRRMRGVFLHLLTNNDYSLLADYKWSRLTELQSKTIFHCYFGEPSLHPLVFPFNLLCENPNLTALIKPRLSEYKPDLVGFQLDRHSLFTDEDRIAILKSIGNQISLYIDEDVAYCAMANGIGDYSHDLQRMISMFDPDHYSKTKYDADLKEMKTKRTELGDFRYAACHAHSLLQLLTHRATTHTDKTKSIIAFLKEVDIDHVPWFLLCRILDLMMQRKMFINKVTSLQVHVPILKIQRRFPYLRSIGGDMDTCLGPWANYLHVIGGHSLFIPKQTLSKDELLEWWADYEHLGQSLLVKRKFNHPLTFLNVLGDSETCWEIVCLLDRITRILGTEAHVQRFITSGELIGTPKPVQDVIVKAYARTLASNLFYRKLSGPQLSPNVYLCLYDKKNCTTPVLVDLYRLLGEQAELPIYIPLKFARHPTRWFLGGTARKVQMQMILACTFVLLIFSRC